MTVGDVPVMSMTTSYSDQPNAKTIAAGFSDVTHVFVPGIAKSEFYTETVNGVRLVDWVRDLIVGKPIGDVHCEDCES